MFFQVIFGPQAAVGQYGSQTSIFTINLLDGISPKPAGSESRTQLIKSARKTFSWPSGSPTWPPSATCPGPTLTAPCCRRVTPLLFGFDLTFCPFTLQFNRRQTHDRSSLLLARSFGPTPSRIPIPSHRSPNPSLSPISRCLHFSTLSRWQFHFARVSVGVQAEMCFWCSPLFTLRFAVFSVPSFCTFKRFVELLRILVKQVREVLTKYIY